MLGAAAMLLGMSSVYAAEPNDRTNRVEITPFAGFMGGGEFEDPADDSERSLEDDTSFGVIVDIADEPWRHYEFIYSQQNTEVGGVSPLDMDVQYLQIGGIVSHPDATRVIPYFGMTIGAARFSPDLSGLDDETKLSFSVAGGVRVPFTDHFGLRFDVRAFVTSLGSDSEVFCVSAPPIGGCSIRAKSDTFLQYAASLGVIFGF
jgi:hypothetical protein